MAACARLTCSEPFNLRRGWQRGFSQKPEPLEDEMERNAESRSTQRPVCLAPQWESDGAFVLLKLRWFVALTRSYNENQIFMQLLKWKFLTRTYCDGQHVRELVQWGNRDEYYCQTQMNRWLMFILTSTNAVCRFTLDIWQKMFARLI